MTVSCNKKTGAFLIVILQILSGNVFSQANRYTYEQGKMGSPFKLIFYATSDSLASKAADSAFKRIDELNRKLSDYLDGSEINRLSITSGSDTWVPVSDDLFEILSKASCFAKESDGAFDITLGPVVQLWRQALRKKKIPTRREISLAKSKSGFHHLLLDGKLCRVKLEKPFMRLDVGGLGKGYAADEVLKIFTGLGISSALIDAGGKIVMSDPPPGKKGWQITISTGSDSLTSMELSNIAIATSGPTYRHYDFGGKRYSHIVDPSTGKGLLHHVRTTVICEDGITADALATTFSVLGIKRSKKLRKKFDIQYLSLTEKNKRNTRVWIYP